MLLELCVGFFQVGLVCFATDVFVVDNAINKLPTTNLYLELCGKVAMNLIDVVTSFPSRGLLPVVASTYLAGCYIKLFH